MKKAKKHTKKHSKKGFSLIELLIVVAIILIIAAIAIPNLLRSRIAANEASSVGSLRTLNTAEVTYNTTYPNVGFACTMGQLGPPNSGLVGSTAAGLIDSNLAAGSKSGYSFYIDNTDCTANTPASFYGFVATPLTPNVTGQRSFCTDPSAVIQFSSAGGTAVSITAPSTSANGGCTNGAPI